MTAVMTDVTQAEVGEERTAVAAGETLVIRGLQDETLCLGGTLRCMAAEAWLVKKP